MYVYKYICIYCNARKYIECWVILLHITLYHSYWLSHISYSNKVYQIIVYHISTQGIMYLCNRTQIHQDPLPRRLCACLAAAVAAQFLDVGTLAADQQPGPQISGPAPSAIVMATFGSFVTYNVGPPSLTFVGCSRFVCYKRQQPELFQYISVMFTNLAI